LAVFAQMGRYHPREPHWYLPLIGVDPPHQGQGYGSAFLQHALLLCDRDHMLASLESTDPKHIPLYERHGCEVLGTMQVGASPPIFPMLRKPRDETCMTVLISSRRRDITGQVLESWTVAALSKGSSGKRRHSVRRWLHGPGEAGTGAPQCRGGGR